MKGLLPRSFAVVAIVFGTVDIGAAGGEDGFSYGERSVEQFVYFFSPEDGVQRQRAIDLQRLVEPFGANLQVTGVIREGGEEAISEHGLKLSYELITAGSARVQLVLPKELESVFVSSEDRAILIGRSGQVVATGSGSELGRVLAHAGSRGIATEIDESTWGKIKELFQ